MAYSQSTDSQDIGSGIPPAGSTGVVRYDVGESGWTDELTELHEAEAGSDHYIDVASREHALQCVGKWAPPAGVVMEIGCSSGHMLRLLQDRLPALQLIGTDYVMGPLERLSHQISGVRLIQFDLTTCPLEDGVADVIVALNVLEHIADHEQAVRQMFRILKPGGKAIIEVPAGPGLYDIYDRQLMHHRRYRMKDLSALFERSGFRVLEKSHLGFFLYPAFWLTKKWNRRYLSAGEEEQRRRVAASIRMARGSKVMTAIMQTEARLRRNVPMPAGIRCLLVAERPARSN